MKTSDEADFGTDEIAEFKSGKTMAEVALGDGGRAAANRHSVSARNVLPRLVLS